MLRLADCDLSGVLRLLCEYGLDLRLIDPGQLIPGSYWGENEAGLQGTTLLARVDTPLHSILHEAAHFICMAPERRVGLDRDAGGDDLEETAVCYLQILLADRLRAFGRVALWRDMDEWGYSFRLGGAQVWFEQDAEEARQWLIAHGLIDRHDQLSGRLR